MINYRERRIKHWDSVALKSDRWSGLGGSYHKRLFSIYRNIIPEKQRVIEFGCSQGDLLAVLFPEHGVGIDFSTEMICRAKKKYPELTFICSDIHEIDISEKFDFIILSDIVNDVWDVQTVLEKVRTLSTPNTRIVINSYSRLWELPLRFSQAAGLSQKTLTQNWLTVDDLRGLLSFAGFEIVRNWQEILFPISVPLIAPFLNSVVCKTWPFTNLALTNFIVAKVANCPVVKKENHTVSVIVAARNESGNIRQIFERTPEMGAGTELIFVEGHSTDNTYEQIQKVMAEFPNRKCKLFRQTGTGKGDAVRLGFQEASGDILMILDADLTVPPETLPRFFDVLVTGKAEFVNGVRMVYPMATEAMRFFNLLGNKFFAIAFSWLLGQSIKDTLCGTKVLWKVDYERISRNRKYFGDFDPFGDFDLIFGAARLNLKIVDMPIRYGERTYGTTNIQRWKHGFLLLRMVMFACRKIKYV